MKRDSLNHSDVVRQSWPAIGPYRSSSCRGCQLETKLQLHSQFLFRNSLRVYLLAILLASLSAAVPSVGRAQESVYAKPVEARMPQRQAEAQLHRETPRIQPVLSTPSSHPAAGGEANRSLVDALGARPPKVVDPAISLEDSSVEARPLNRRSERDTLEPDPDRDRSPRNTMTVVVTSLSIVLGAFFLFVWITRKTPGATTTRLPTEAVDLLGTTTLPGRQQLQLLRVGRKLVLLSIHSHEVRCVTEVTDPVEVDHLCQLCQQSRPGSVSHTFREVLTQMGNESLDSTPANPSRRVNHQRRSRTYR